MAEEKAAAEAHHKASGSIDAKGVTSAADYEAQRDIHSFEMMELTLEAAEKAAQLRKRSKQ